ncbi:MAG: transposase [Clostridia bacterium]|nr:transposase [Clostridia bacterium]
MEDLLTKAGIAYIVSRILDNAKDAVEESKTNNSDFINGKKMAYYEVLNTIKNELIVRDADLKAYSLDFALETLI